MVRARLAEPGLAEERRRDGQPLFRAQGACRQGLELGTNQARRTVRGAVPILWSRESTLREDMEASGYRGDRMNLKQRSIMLLFAIVPGVAAAQPQKIPSRIGTLEFTHGFANGYPTDATLK